MLTRSILIRRSSSFTALIGVVVAAATATAILTLYTDLESKLHKEFRGYGANLLLTPKEESSGALPSGTLGRVDAVIAGHGIAAPFAYVIARTSSGTPVVVSGVDFTRIRALNSWWSVTGWPANPGEGLFGKRVADSLKAELPKITVVCRGKELHLTSAGILTTGSAEDSRIYISLDDFSRWTGLEPSSIEIAAEGAPGDVELMARNLTSGLPEVRVRPLRQVVEAEAAVLQKSKLIMLACTAAIMLTIGLCMLSTFTASILERKKDFALMKALGASQDALMVMFVMEAAVLGAAGAPLGFLLGLGVAEWIGKANFHASVRIHFWVFPLVFLLSVVIASLATIVPMRLMRGLQPAALLKGE